MTNTLHPHPDRGCATSDESALAAAIAELTAYLRSQQAAQERWRSWRIAAAVFLASMLASAAVTSALNRSRFRKRAHQAEVMTVEMRRNAVNSPRLRL